MSIVRAYVPSFQVWVGWWRLLPIEYGRSDTICLPRIGHKRLHSFCLFSWFTESPCEKFNFPWATMLERLWISTMDDGPSHAQPARRPFILVREPDMRVKKPPGKWILQSQIFEPSELWLQILWTEKSHAHWAPSEFLTPESVSTIYIMVVILQH